MRNGGKWRDFEPFWLTWNLTWTRKTKREERNSKNELRLDAMGFGKKNSVTAAICGQINEVNASPLSAWEGGGGGEGEVLPTSVDGCRLAAKTRKKGPNGSVPNVGRIFRHFSFDYRAIAIRIGETQ